MPACEHCGVALTNLAYSCNYCGQDHCSSHRLPENHDCIALALARPPESSRAAADARPGSPRDFQNTDFVDYVEAFRDEHVEADEVDTEPIRETLADEAPDASADEVAEAAEQVASELNEPSGEPYSTFEPTYTVGTTPEPEYSPSPDMAPDGSLKAGAKEPSGQLNEGQSGRIARWSKGGVVILLFLALLAILVFFL